MRARPVIPGRTYLITRRCSDRRFFLRPSRKTNRIVRYELLRAAKEHGVQVHAFLFMSNHVHLVVTDVLRTLPLFMRDFLREVSKAVSASIGRWNGLWEPGTYSAVALLDPQSVIEKIAYCLANPVLSGLVRRARRWPGATSIGIQFGETMRVHRPKTPYYANSEKSEIVELELTTPTGMDPIELQHTLAKQIRAHEKAAAAELAQQNRKFVGERSILAQDPFDCPTSWEKRRGRNPTFASTDKWKRVEAGQRKQSWYAAYRAALASFCGDVRDVVFPAGTWWMVEFFNCSCEPHAPSG